MVGGSCRIGCNQSESYRIAAGKALAPVVENLIAEAAITAKSTDRKPALLLLPDQLRPLLLIRCTRLDSFHPSHYRTAPSHAPEGFISRLLCWKACVSRTWRNSGICLYPLTRRNCF